ncbi:NmrA/HSCARG family protein [Burkholderia sp. 22PA0106]|uniref:NmrA/HSCARG family protein n=1 Tax=Burkholderia sp. 22PA0106 TaxID=3237371 RepID=UPI0039C09FAA
MAIDRERTHGVVLVFGATGQQGGAVAAALKEQGWAVRALVRDPQADKPRALAARGIELVRGDFADPESIRTAMQGAYGVFSVQPSSGQGTAYNVSDEQEVRYGTTIADLAVEAGVQHLVYTSVNAAGPEKTGMGHFDSKSAIEAHIRGLALTSTIVRPAGFMELLMLPGMGLDQDAYTFFLRPGQAGQTIAAQDIGRIVAKIFAAPERFAGRTLEIAGDQLTAESLQASLSRAAGRPIRYARFPDSLLAQNPFLGRLAELFDDGRLAGHADIPALEQEFGPLLDFDAWLAGPGKPLFEAALAADAAQIALR